MTFDEADFPFSNVYHHLRSHASTPLMEAWYKSLPLSHDIRSPVDQESSTAKEPPLQTVIQVLNRVNPVAQVQQSVSQSTSETSKGSSSTESSP